jgi:hypothetical protein
MREVKEVKKLLKETNCRVRRRKKKDRKERECKERRR